MERPDFPEELSRRVPPGRKIVLNSHGFLVYLIEHRLLPKKLQDVLTGIGGYKSAYEEARARKTRLQADLLEGQYIAKTDVRKALMDRVVFFKKGMLALLQSLPPRLEGQEARTIAKTMKEAFHELLREYAAGDLVIDGLSEEETKL